MNIDDQNEKNDFLKSDGTGTGTEKNTSSENEHHVTYAGTDSMYDDPKSKYNRVVRKKNDTRLQKSTYGTSSSNTVQKNAYLIIIFLILTKVIVSVKYKIIFCQLMYLTVCSM